MMMKRFILLPEDYYRYSRISNFERIIGVNDFDLGRQFIWLNAESIYILIELLG